MDLRPVVGAAIFLFGTGINGLLRSPGSPSGRATQTAGVLSSNVPDLVYVDGVKYAKTDVGIQAALAAAGAGTVVLGPGTYTLASAITMTTSGQHLVCSGIGATTLSYTGTKDIPAVVDVGTASDGTRNLFNISMNDCTVSGNSHVRDAIRTRGVHHSDFSNNSLINVAEAGIHTNFGVVLNLSDLHTSTNEQAFTQLPTNCIILDGPDGGHQTTTVNMNGDICEGISRGDGWLFKQAASISVVGGTSEGNGRGVNATATSSQVTLIGNDFEANSIEDVLINGATVVFEGVICGSHNQVHVGSTSGVVWLMTGGCALSIHDSGFGGVYHAFDVSTMSGLSHWIMDDGIQTLTGKRLNGFATAFSVESGAYTLTTKDSWVNVTGGTTITVPHALRGQRWVVFNSGVATVTLHPDSGNINGAASITLAANTGKEVTCDGTNCWAK
jgi:hypothetical protein